MATPIRILGIAGSLRKHSYNKGALRAAQQLVPDNATLEVFDIKDILRTTRISKLSRRNL